MSWFSDITGKAENLLTRLDQSAATVLQVDEQNHDNKPHVPRTDYETSRDYQSSYQPSLPYSASVPANLGNHKLTTNVPASPTPSRQTVKSTNVSQAGSKVDSDDALFAFLNSSESATKKTSIASSQHSRHSSVSSVKSTKSAKGAASNESKVQHPPSPTSGTPPETFVPVTDTETDIYHSDPPEIDTPHHDDNGSSMTLEHENRLMKAELSSLNQEMASIIQRAKQSQEEVVRLKEKIATYNNSASHSDQIVRELQARETDLSQALAAKDSQLAVLRVRLEEADRTLDERRRVLDDLQTNNTRILQDHTDSTGIHTQALESLKEKLNDAQRDLKREQEACQKLRDEASQRQTSLETEQKGLTEALSTTQRKLSDETGRYNQLNNQMRMVKSNLQISRQELADYKDKAARILQSKERLIASLREGPGASGESAGVSQLEYDAVKQERDMFREDLQQYKMTVDNYKYEIQEMEVSHQTETETNQGQICSLEDMMSREKERAESLQLELDSNKQEMNYSLEELSRQKTLMQLRIDEREKDIEKLRTQLTTKSMSSVTESELESRVRALTESLIHKQTTLEALSTEKTSLNLQLERLNQKYQDIQSIPVRNSTAIVINEDEEGRPRGPGFLREHLGDAAVTRKVKRAANTIDRFSIRLGVFLRRYPIARVIVILYMFFLHVWVTFVLLTYQPEMHPVDVYPKPPQ